MSMIKSQRPTEESQEERDVLGMPSSEDVPCPDLVQAWLDTVEEIRAKVDPSDLISLHVRAVDIMSWAWSARTEEEEAQAWKKLNELREDVSERFG